MAKKIVVLVGSPRSQGNTEIISDAFIKGAESAGCQVVKILLKDKKINGCIDCKYCFKHEGVCSQKDDMFDIYPHLWDSEAIVFASPIYFFGLSAQIKAPIDRMFAGIGKKFTIKQSALLLVHEDKETYLEKPIIEQYQNMARYIGWEDKGVIAVANVFDKGAINANPKLSEAEALGKSFA